MTNCLSIRKIISKKEFFPLYFTLFFSYDGEDMELRALHFWRLEWRLLLSAILLAIFQPDIFGRFQASTKYFTKNRTYIIDSKKIVYFLQFYKNKIF